MSEMLKSGRQVVNDLLADPRGSLLMVRPLVDTLDDIMYAGALTEATIDAIDKDYTSQVYVVLPDALWNDIAVKGIDVLGLLDNAKIIVGEFGSILFCLGNTNHGGFVIGYNFKQD